MSFFIVDVEADGLIPYKYSMLSIGAVKVLKNLDECPTFYTTLKPISDNWNEKSLAITGFTREETLSFRDPKEAMQDFSEWIKNNNKNGRPIFISDNNGFDFAWVNWYFHYFLNDNPFGWSSRRIGDFYSGLTKDWYGTWKHLRKIEHNHNALQDALANTSAFLEIIDQFDVKISLK